MKTLPLAEVRANLSRLIDQVVKLRYLDARVTDGLAGLPTVTSAAYPWGPVPDVISEDPRLVRAACQNQVT
jgi:hypothetical protein